MATYCTPDQIRNALRLDGLTTFDEERIVRATEVATAVADHKMDRPVDPLPVPTPAPVVQYCINLGVRVYKAAGAPHGQLGFTGAESFMTLSGDITRPDEELLQPYKLSAGVVA